MSTIPIAIANDLDALCALLDAELARQKNVLEVAVHLSVAAHGQDFAGLDRHTLSLAELMRESASSERDRIQLLHPIVKFFELEGADQTLSNLITAVPEPWKGKLAAFQSTLRSVVGQSRAQLRHNAGVMRTTFRRIDGVMDQLFQDGAARRYTPGGRDQRAERAASLMDTTG